MDRISPLPGNELAFVDFEEKAEPYTRPSTTTDIDQANLLTSRVALKPDEEYDIFAEPKHKVVIDLDLPAKLVPSTTPDHFHLIIDHEIGEDQYFKLLDVMAECGLIEPGYVHASKDRGYTAVRLPWVRKGAQDVSERY